MRTWLESMPGVAVRLALEKAVARVVELDTVTAKRLGELDGQVLQITSTLPELTFYLRFRADGLDILAVSEEPVSASLKGTSTELFRLLLAEEPLVQLQQGHLELSGNTDLLLMLAGILQEAEFDWEMLVAHHTGGVVAHALGSVARAGASTSRQLADTFLANFPEYLQEELRVLPAPGEVEAFQSDLDELRLAADRLEARISLLNENQKVPTGGQ